MEQKTVSISMKEPAFMGIKDSGSEFSQGLTKREYFAAMAMHPVVLEMQEMVVASFWDWCKKLLQDYCQMSFLHVKYKIVNGMYEQAAKKAVQYADAVLFELNK